MNLGMAVRQPENEALAPAFAIERRLLTLGAGFILLFIVFTLLSVHSVASPLRRLTLAVRSSEANSLALTLPSFGRDEVGQLARALDRWRGRVVEAVNALG